ncbi:NAD(P)H-dependent oxidoreductase [Holophaga foetida]|uniref:NAD(P)H-dependent oxidoreductase n=1 Tax=Holophaga foetida TaxID=35839 RepID=UPI00024717BA|nr:NAD(P)H-dependent oxidoreductase [Holophaga foetida]
MKILVLGGSPKGEASITLRYTRFLGMRFPEHRFEEVYVAASVRSLEKNLGELIAKVREADLVVFAFPLYVCLVHAAYKRFFELVEERALSSAFAGKPALLLATSIHWHDHTALEYVRGMAEDWGMGVCGVYSAGMDDLVKASERNRLEAFGRLAFRRAASGELPRRETAPRPDWDYVYAPQAGPARVDPRGLRALIVTDGAPGSGIRAMAERFGELFGGDSELVDLNALPMKGGCQGCIQCGLDNRCTYGDSDGVQAVYREKLRRADIVVWAYGIRDRYWSARAKTFIDRRFLDTHQPNAVGKQVVYLVSGPLSAHANLRQIISTMEEFSGGNLAALVTDEPRDTAAIDRAIRGAAECAVECHQVGYQAPRTFAGVGGAKVFRDEIWGKLRFPFVADHRYYKAHHFYDFPQKEWGARLKTTLLRALVHIPAIRRAILVDMKRHMVRPLDRVLESIRTSPGTP